MKKYLTALLCLLLLTASALAEDAAVPEPAAARFRAVLLDAPHEQATPLMRYHLGTRVEVIREVDSTYLLVNVGEPGGSLMGYMDRGVLAHGEAEIRAVRAEYVTYMPSEIGAAMTLYSYPDVQAPVINPVYHIGLKQVLGSLDGEWLHVEDERGVTGFVRADEIPLEGPEYEYAYYIEVEPGEGELSVEAAIAHAKETILSDPALYASTPDIEVTAARLEADEPTVDVLYYYDMPGVLTYIVDFRSPETGYIDAGISFLVEGEAIQSAHAGNG